jgi:hypothetical protein
MSHIKSSRSKQLATLHMMFQTIGHVEKINGRDLTGHAMDQSHPIYACYGVKHPSGQSPPFFKKGEIESDIMYIARTLLTLIVYAN